jgi:hypothetical protein
MKTYLTGLILLLIGCTTTNEQGDSPFEYELIENNWKHSWEEDTSQHIIKTFRPADYMEFPSAWYREQLIFEQDSVVQWLYLAPNDGHYFKTGKWWLSAPEDSLLSIQYEPENDQVTDYKILVLNDSTLKMEILTFDIAH